MLSVNKSYFLEGITQIFLNMTQNGTVAKSDNTEEKCPGLSWKHALDGVFDNEISIPETTGRLYRILFSFIRTHAL
jgi:hypothetical protein